jgi:hypothetical protein
MTKKKTYGKTASGVPISEELVTKLAEKAETGYDCRCHRDARMRARDPKRQNPPKQA